MIGTYTKIRKVPNDFIIILCISQPLNYKLPRKLNYKLRTKAQTIHTNAFLLAICLIERNTIVVSYHIKNIPKYCLDLYFQTYPDSSSSSNQSSVK